jgi:hypothetical protein
MEASNIAEMVIALMTFLKIVFNFFPSERAIRIFGFIDDMIDFFVKDKSTEDDED